MTTPYLPILLWDSLLRTGRFLDDTLAIKANQLRIEWQSYGGFWSLSYTQDCTQSEVEEWLEEGLGRHFEVYTPGGTRIWEGFADQVQANIGGLTITRGPLIGEVTNKIMCVYSSVDTSTTPPTMGIRSPTTWAQDAASQAKWGIIERVMSVGGATLTSAEQMRDTMIIQKAEPPTSESDNLTGSRTPSINVTVLGYIHWLKAFHLVLTTTGDQNASAKLLAILGADPNSIFSTDYTQITTNTVQVGAYDDDNRVANSSVSGIVGLGGTTNERWLLGFGADRVCHYFAAPTTQEYVRRLSEPSQAVRTWADDREIPYYEVGAGEWLFYTDFFAGRLIPSTLAERYEDPRYLFIEHATWSMPAALTLKGAESQELKSLMSKLGLGGQKA